MRFFTLGLLLSLSFVLSAQTNHAVEVRSNVFDPADITIQVGDTVTWTNVQGVHNVNGSTTTYPNNPVGFRSGNAMAPPWTFQFVFETAGAYDYQCDPHVSLNMVGTVTVEAAAPAGNVVITEINYNSAESGSDTTEFIELYNIGPGAVNMAGWSFTEGFEFTFPDYTLAENAYVVLAVNDTAVMNRYNYSGDIFEWTSGGLSNGGEDIRLVDQNGTEIDYVDYDDAAPWPTEADQGGPSLVLCDFAADNNLGQNWQAASTSTGMIINDLEVFGNPGAASECGLLDPILYWLDDFENLDEDAGTIQVGVVAQNYTTIGPVINVSLDGSSTADGGDFTTDPALPIMLTSDMTALDTFFFTLTITDDGDAEMEESIVLALGGNGMISDTFATFNIADNDSEVVITAIDDINDIDDNGDAVSDGQEVTLRGVTHCVDFRGGDGHQFALIEPATGNGITVFNFNDIDGYAFMEGDELTVSGEVDQFRGLLQLRVNSITVESTGNALVAPVPVNTLSEDTENKHVSLAVDTLLSLGRAGGGFNASVITVGGDTVTIRAEDEINVDSTFIADFFATADAASFVVTGVGGQFDNNDPLLDGYQLLPCGASSFGVISSVNEPAWAAEMEIFPNPTSDLLTARTPVSVDEYRLVNLNGQVVSRGVNTGTVTRIRTADLPTGMYVLQLISGNELVSRPVIKQ